MKSIFGSYKHEDKRWKMKVEKWAKDGRLGENVTIVGESKDVRQGGNNAIKDHLNPKLKGASDVIVFIGDDTHNSTGVNYEIQHAKSHHKNIIPVRIPDTTGAVPEAIRGEKIVAFEPNAIKKALDEK